MLAATSLRLGPAPARADDIEPCTDTFPLATWWSGARADNFLASTPAENDAASAAGYQFVRHDGYACAYRVPGTVQLVLYWSNARGDNFTTGTVAGENDANAAEYALVGFKGWVYQDQQPFTQGLYL
jgi:hypothetical protein